MIVLPVTDAGARIFELNTGFGIYKFRTYYSVGQESCWILDVLSDDVVIASGLKLVPGSANIFKGLGDTLSGFQLYVLRLQGDAGAQNALGKDVKLLLYIPGEENLYKPKDILDSLDEMGLLV